MNVGRQLVGGGWRYFFDYFQSCVRGHTRHSCALRISVRTEAKLLTTPIELEVTI